MRLSLPLPDTFHPRAAGGTDHLHAVTRVILAVAGGFDHDFFTVFQPDNEFRALDCPGSPPESTP